MLTDAGDNLTTGQNSVQSSLCVCGVCLQSHISGCHRCIVSVPVNSHLMQMYISKMT